MLKKILPLMLTVGLITVQAEERPKVDLEKRMQSFNVPQNMEINVWADQSLTQNPGYFSFDSQGRLLIAEIYRVHKGVGDVRGFSPALTIADLSIKTIEDRLAMYHKFKNELPDSQFGNTSDIVKLIEDTDNDGVADSSKVFADEFNNPLDGLGSGVIERNGKVYYTNIPHLWQLEDLDNDGISDKKTPLITGFGTRVSFLGHDLHGLAWGPDGRLYWSIGDRGYYLKDDNGNIIDGQNLGAIFRANPDGSNIEVFYTGLRNPQEIAFDHYGNLFTADNDGDHGDTERINHIIEGGDSGWHAGHQTIMSFANHIGLNSSKYTGEARIPTAWLVNDMSLPRNDKQPAFMLPGIGQLFTGPSGLTFNPSGYLGEKWRDTFFIAHYGGSPTGSFISTFKAKENGASFLATEQEEFLRGLNISDIEFGPDGRFYVAEFNFGGWGAMNEGAIYALNLKNPSDTLQASTTLYKDILASDFTAKSFEELSELLAIDHQKIRQRAQFTMAERGIDAFKYFEKIALNTNKDIYSRIHSIWGISQLVLTKAADKNILKTLLPLLSDTQDQVRIQTTRVLSDHGAKFAERALIKALHDQHNQVAMYAALGLGKINATKAVNTIIFKLQQNADQDLWLRHALTMALKGIDKQHWFDKFKQHPSKSVRMGVLLALRLLADDDIAYFLNDTEKSLIDETIIAIDDKQLVNVRAKMAKLLNANMPTETVTDAYLHHRLINANYNEGKAENAKRILTYAANNNLPDRIAAEALAAIEGWQDIHPIDSITGLPTTANKNRDDISNIIYNNITGVLAATKDKALVQAMRLAGSVNYVFEEKLLMTIVKNKLANNNIRKQALALLNSNFNHTIIPVTQELLTEKSSKIKTIALAMMLKNDEQLALEIITNYLQSDSLDDQKVALSQLTAKTTPEIDNLLIKKLVALNGNSLPKQLILELVSAAENNKNSKVTSLLNQYKTSLETADLLTQFAGTLAGGDPELGEEIFYGDAAAQCIRCHRVQGVGSWVGPDLTNIAKTRNTEYLLQALIDPSAAIAPGYGTVTISMNDGQSISGTYFGETDTTMSIGKDRHNQQKYSKSDISNIQWAVSGMPPMRYILSKEKIRDVLAFLNTLKAEKKPAGEGH